MVFSLLKRETRRKLIINANIRRHHLAIAHGALGGGFNEFIGNQFDFFFQPRFTHLPRDTADFIEVHGHIITAKTAQQLNVLDRQKQPRLAVINQLEAIMRRAADINGLQALKAANAMLNMHNMVARRQARCLS